MQCNKNVIRDLWYSFRHHRLNIKYIVFVCPMIVKYLRGISLSHTCTPDNNNNKKKSVQRSKVKWYPIIITLKRCVFCQSFVDRCLPSFYYYFPFRLFLPPFFTTETQKTNIFSEQLTLVRRHSKTGCFQFFVSFFMFHFSVWNTACINR